MKDKTLDMTVGNPIRHIIMFSIPALIGNIFQQVYKSCGFYYSRAVCRLRCVGGSRSYRFHQKVVNSFGTVVVAAFTATCRIEQLAHQPYQTLSASLSTYCGQNYGANDHKRVLKGYHQSLVVMCICTVFLVIIMQFFGRAITSLFVSEPEVIELGAKGLRITSYFYLMLGLIYVVRGILNGVGDAFFALFNGIVEVIGRFTVPVLMAVYMGIGELGIWWSCGVVWAISGGTAWLRYLKYYFYQKKLQ